MDTKGFEFKLTCGACPEQYDVLLDGKYMAYLRLRHGYFYASVPDVGGKVVYDANPKGDGIFESDEREFHLQNAYDAIVKHYLEEGKIVLGDCNECKKERWFHTNKTITPCKVCNPPPKNNKERYI